MLHILPLFSPNFKMLFIILRIQKPGKDAQDSRPRAGSERNNGPSTRTKGHAEIKKVQVPGYFFPAENAFAISFPQAK